MKVITASAHLCIFLLSFTFIGGSASLVFYMRNCGDKFHDENGQPNNKARRFFKSLQPEKTALVGCLDQNMTMKTREKLRILILDLKRQVYSVGKHLCAWLQSNLSTILCKCDSASDHVFGEVICNLVYACCNACIMHYVTIIKYSSFLPLSKLCCAICLGAVEKK